jgi:phosphoesterase RecJ-like protein
MKPSPGEPIKDKIVEAIRDDQVFLLLTHVSPDGDSLGSLVALRRILAGLGKECSVLFPGEIPPKYRFLIAGEEILQSVPPREKWDVVFLLDIPSASRLPASLRGEIPPCKELINIDHHASNNIEGSLNWIDARASSVGEMLFWLFDDAGYGISPDVATALYTAILTDTGSFRFPNTTSSSLQAAARLVDHGADPARVADEVYGSHSFRKYRLLTRVLGTLQTCCSRRVAYMWVTKEMLEKLGASAVEADGFINFPREIRGVEVAVLFKQDTDEKEVRVSLRSKGKRVEVGRVAEKFDGGGHPAAAGCTLTGSVRSVQQRVLQAIAEELARADAAASASPASEVSWKE